MADQTYVSLDLELIDPNTPHSRIIEIGAVRFTDRGVLDEWSTLVNPGVALPYTIRTLTGISEDELATAPALEKVAERVRAFVGESVLVGQSIEIDVAHLERQGVWLDTDLIDTYELGALLLPGLPSYDLLSIASALRVPSGAAHRALADAHLAREVFLALGARVRAVDLEILMHVNRLTAGFNWPFRGLFVEAERDKRQAMVGEALSGGAVAPIDLGLSHVLVPPETRDEPLVPNAQMLGIDAAGLARELRSGGVVANALAMYEERPQQIEMLDAVTAAFNKSHHLIVEAGTGTGKSMAYLLPSLAYAAANNKRVVVSTNTINLQDQLYQKDVPGLIAAMDYRVRASVLKGRTNYLCLQRWVTLLRSDIISPEEATLLVKTLLWVTQTATGDRAELRLTLEEEPVWSRVCSQAEICTPTTCSYHKNGSCFIARARRAADASHIVIVNHALLLSDLATGNRVIPEYEHVVIDEAHHLENEATNQLGYTLTYRAVATPLETLTRSAGRDAGAVQMAVALLRLGGLAPRRVAQLDEIAAAISANAVGAIRILGELFDGVRDFLQSQATGAEPIRSVRLTTSARRQGNWMSVEQSAEELRSILEQIGEGLKPVLEDLGDAASADGGEPISDQLAQLTGIAYQLDVLMQQVRAIILKPSAEAVCWVTQPTAGPAWAPLDGMGITPTPMLHYAPLDVAPALKAWLMDNKATTVLTSATLTTDGSFDYMRDRIGASEAQELALGSPFDYERAALLVLPDDIPEPNQPGYVRKCAETIADVAEALGGRTLVLFTSYAQLRATHDLIRDRIDRAQISLMAQGVDGSRTRLLQRFRTSERALLLGTASFWEGVDVVGEALSALVIARLPFSVPTDPVFAARSEQFEDPFRQYAVPQAILKFKQGFGRLIRSATDRGVVVVLDRRVLSKSYGAGFLHSLPVCTTRLASAASVGDIAEEWLAPTR